MNQSIVNFLYEELEQLLISCNHMKWMKGLSSSLAQPRRSLFEIDSFLFLSGQSGLRRMNLLHDCTSTKTYH